MEDYLIELCDQLVQDIETELLEDEEGGSYSAVLLAQKVKSAVREMVSLRRYPSSYTEEMITADLKRLYSVIRRLAMYDYNAIGMEFESSHSEKNISRNFRRREYILYGVFPISKVI